MYIALKEIKMKIISKISKAKSLITVIVVVSDILQK